MAQPSSPNIDVTADEINQDILGRLRAQDPELNAVFVSADRSDLNDDGDEYVYDTAEGGAGCLGQCLGDSVHVRYLDVKYQDTDGEASEADMTSFVEGINRNRSIREVELGHLNVFGGKIFQNLLPFFRDNPLLTTLTVEDCHLGREGGRHLSQALSGCASKSLDSIRLDNCGLDDDSSAEIITSLGQHPNLTSIYLCSNEVGRRGCSAMASLLRNSASKLKTLDLHNTNIDDVGLDAISGALPGNRELEQLKFRGTQSISRRGLWSLAAPLECTNSRLCSLNVSLANMKIDDEVAATFAEALQGNRTLHSLVFEDSSCHRITAKGWSALGKLLCDTSSINKTYLSNHTLRTILGYQPDALPYDVRSKLAMNSWLHTESQIATNKILLHHGDFDMRPFFEWEFRMLPIVMKWYEAAQTTPRAFDADLNRRKLSSIYQFVRGLTPLYIDTIQRGKVNDGALRASKRMKMCPQDDPDLPLRRIVSHEPSSNEGRAPFDDPRASWGEGM